MQIKRKVLLSVAAAALVAGMLSYALLADAGSVGSNSTTQGLRIEGHAVIKVFNSQGMVVSTWQGYNALDSEGLNALAGCLSGQATHPFPNSANCYDLTNGTQINWFCNTGSCAGAPITQTSTETEGCAGTVCSADAAASEVVTPALCNPSAALCGTGWNVTSTFTGMFNAQNCGSSCTITGAHAGMSDSSIGVLVGIGLLFDDLFPSITVAPGDSLQLTITFSIS